MLNYCKGNQILMHCQSYKTKISKKKNDNVEKRKTHSIKKKKHLVKWNSIT